jgi:hypothetical protein
MPKPATRAGREGSANAGSVAGVTATANDGQAGLADRRLSASPRHASVAEIERMLGLYRDLYRGFTVKPMSSWANGTTTHWATR